MLRRTRCFNWSNKSWIVSAIKFHLQNAKHSNMFPSFINRLKWAHSAHYKTNQTRLRRNLHAKPTPPRFWLDSSPSSAGCFIAPISTNWFSSTCSRQELQNKEKNTPKWVTHTLSGPTMYILYRQSLWPTLLPFNILFL